MTAELLEGDEFEIGCYDLSAHCTSSRMLSSIGKHILLCKTAVPALDKALTAVCHDATVIVHLFTWPTNKLRFADES